MAKDAYYLTAADRTKIDQMLQWFDRNRSGAGTVRRNPRHLIIGDTIRRAITTAAAGATATITANLYDSDGVEQETGDEAGITVYCTVVGGTKLNEAIPELAIETDILVVQSPFNATTKRWYALQIFQTYDVSMFDVDTGKFVHLYDSDMFNYTNNELESNLDECE